MPSAKRRIHLTISERTEKILEQIAEEEDSSVTTVALYLLLRALDLHEDEWLLKIALEREKKQ